MAKLRTSVCYGAHELEQVLSITSAASGAGICKESVAAAGAC